MKVLVAVASKHGATTEIGKAIAATLQDKGVYAAVMSPEHVSRVDGYDAVIVGSALYMGRWLGPARDFIQTNADDLRRLPVWLFASGPVTPVDDEGDAAEGKKLAELIGARDAKVFAGQLKQDSLGFVEKQVVRMIKSPWGDYRPWSAIAAWAGEIADELRAVPAG